MTAIVEIPPILVRLRPVINLSDDDFLESLPRQSRLAPRADVRWRRGDHVAPAGGEAGQRNAELVRQLGNWARADGTGIAFDSSAGFSLPEGAVRAPDAAWVLRERLGGLTPEQRQKFLPLCPDFVVEIRSPTDRLKDLEARKWTSTSPTAHASAGCSTPSPGACRSFDPTLRSSTADEATSISAIPSSPASHSTCAEIWSPAN